MAERDYLKTFSGFVQEPRLMVIAALASLVLLVAANQLAELIGVPETFRIVFELILVVILVVSVVGLIVAVSAPRIEGRWAAKARRQELLAQLKTLTSPEKDLFRKAIEKDQRSLQLPVLSGMGPGLADRGLMKKVSSMDRRGVALFQIEEDVWLELRRDPDLLGGSTSDEFEEPDTP